MDSKCLDAVKTSSAKWRAAFNAGNAEGCAAMYEPNATMTASPFGTFVGRDAIRDFWEKLIADGYENVEYINAKITALDTKATSGVRSAILSADWKMNKAHGTISQELWVVQPSGDALLRVDEFQVAS